MHININKSAGQSIDLTEFGIGDEEVISLDINSTARPISLYRIPPSVQSLQLGQNLSESLVSPLVLPTNIISYRGPIFHDTILPQSLESLTLVENLSSIPIEELSIPQNVTELGIVVKNKESSIDGLVVPEMTTSLKIEGPFNMSIDNFEGKNISSIFLPPSYTQASENIPNLTLDSQRDIKDSIPTICSKESLEAIRKYVPTMNHIRVILGENIEDILDVWTKVLLEARVKVRSIEIDASNIKSSNVIKNMHVALDRSTKLGRPFCKKITIHGINTTDIDISYLKIAESLIYQCDLDIILKHTSPINDISLRLADIMGLSDRRYDDEKECHIYYKSFGANMSEVCIYGSTIRITRGQCPIQKRNIRPESSFFVSPPPAPSKDIILYTWTKCGYCKKQNNIIETFKRENPESLDTFDEMISIIEVDDPSTIKDHDITSFPSWVINSEIVPGVKDSGSIGELLQT